MDKCIPFYEPLTHQIILGSEEKIAKVFEETNKVIKETETEPFEYKHASFDEFKKAMANKETFTLE